MENGRLWVWFTYYPTHGHSEMSMMRAEEFLPVYLRIARNRHYRIIHDERIRDTFRVYDLTGTLILDAETV